VKEEKNIAAIADPLRSLVFHETEQINRRLTWLATLQGLLLAALGFAWEKGGKDLLAVFASMGVAVSLLVYTSLIGSVIAMNKIRSCWLRHRPKGYDGPDIFGTYPERARFITYLSPETLIPIVFIGGWIAIAFLIPNIAKPG
jgi:hypothetical protein